MTFGHEDVREAIKTHLVAQLPIQLAALRARRNVTSPVDPVAYLLADTLDVRSAYPLVLVRSPDMSSTRDHGDGIWVTAYSIEVAVAVEVTTAGAYAAASVDRDRLSEALRMALLTPASTLSDDVVIAHKTLTESHGPAAETLVGRPLAVGLAAFTAVVTETLPTAWTGEQIDAGDITATGVPQSGSI